MYIGRLNEDIHSGARRLLKELSDGEDDDLEAWSLELWTGLLSFPLGIRWLPLECVRRSARSEACLAGLAVRLGRIARAGGSGLSVRGYYLVFDFSEAWMWSGQGDTGWVRDGMGMLQKR